MAGRAIIFILPKETRDTVHFHKGVSGMVKLYDSPKLSFQPDGEVVKRVKKGEKPSKKGEWVYMISIKVGKASQLNCCRRLYKLSVSNCLLICDFHVVDPPKRRESLNALQKTKNESQNQVKSEKVLRPAVNGNNQAPRKGVAQGQVATQKSEKRNQTSGVDVKSRVNGKMQSQQKTKLQMRHNWRRIKKNRKKLRRKPGKHRRNRMKNEKRRRGGSDKRKLSKLKPMLPLTRWVSVHVRILINKSLMIIDDCVLSIITDQWSCWVHSHYPPQRSSVAAAGGAGDSCLAVTLLYPVKYWVIQSSSFQFISFSVITWAETWYSYLHPPHRVLLMSPSVMVFKVSRSRKLQPLQEYRDHRQQRGHDEDQIHQSQVCERIRNRTKRDHVDR